MSALGDLRKMFNEQVRCPSEVCPVCSGEACLMCGAGLTQYGQPDGEPCEHDCIDRHEGMDPKE